MVIMLYFHCKTVNNYPGPNPPNPGLRPRVNPGFGFEKPAGYPGLRGPGFGWPNPKLSGIYELDTGSRTEIMKFEGHR